MKYSSLHLFEKESIRDDVRSEELLCVGGRAETVDEDKPLVDNHDIVQSDDRGLQ